MQAKNSIAVGKNKLARFKENEENPLVIQAGKPFFESCKGKWRSDFFKNDNPICLELACGRGEYSVGLGRLFPDRNYIGIDIKGARLWKGASIALHEGLKNVAFLRTFIHDLDKFFAPDEVDEIWLIHPDPRPRKRDIRRRLTNPRFLDIYRRIMKADGWVKLKTDSALLYEYTLEVLSQYPIRDLEHTDDLYNSPLYAEHYGICTRYEEEFTAQGHKIHYLKFRFKQQTTQ